MANLPINFQHLVIDKVKKLFSCTSACIWCNFTLCLASHWLIDNRKDYPSKTSGLEQASTNIKISDSHDTQKKRKSVRNGEINAGSNKY